ncbi:unnamed protein product [Linum tenue]|uniref:Uncharacterized protein n=1 Tax=Linum tenue TaxID=586396 RepID=A0AAV0LZW6_9ROSI|nr:unnamed protein product [Linum tenue]
MEKNKNRTDLLAAGRKRLQQFRQKKDVKGSSSNAKSGKKSGKSEPREADVDMTSKEPESAGLQQVLEEENMTHLDSNSGSLDSLQNSVATTDHVTDVSQSAISPELEFVEDWMMPAHTSELSAQDVRSLDNANDHVESNKSTIMAIEESSMPVVISETQDPNIVSVSTASTDVTNEKNMADKEENKDSVQSDEGASTVPLLPEGELQATNVDAVITEKNMTLREENEESVQSEEGASTVLTGTEGELQVTNVDAVITEKNMTLKEENKESVQSEGGGSTLPFVLEGEPQITNLGASTAEENMMHMEENVQSVQSEEGGYVPLVLEGEPEATDLSASTTEENMMHREENKESAESEDGASTAPLVLEGELQEAHGLVSRQLDSSYGTIPKIDGQPSASESSVPAGTVKGEAGIDVGVEQAVTLSEKIHADASALTLRMERSDGLMQSVLPASEEYCTSSASSVVDMTEMQSQSDHCSKEHDGSEREKEKSMGFVNKRSDKPPPDGNIRPSESGPTPITLVQLIEAIKGLNEDDFGLLIKSRASVSEVELDTDDLTGPQPGYHAHLEKLSEELFVASCRSDIFHLQLSEQLDLQNENDRQFLQLNEEISRMRASVKEAHAKNDNLFQELSACRSDLNDAVGSKAELQSQLEASKAEVDEVSARANKLQSSLESSESDLLTVSKELAHLKDLAESLKVESSELNESLASATDERRSLSDEKEFLLQENAKLLRELDMSKNVIAALNIEISELSGNLVSVADEKKKLEEEKVRLVALRVENTDLNENLVLLKEQHKKLEDDNMNMIHENEGLRSEVLGLHATLSNHQVEHMQLEAEMQEMALRLEQLATENKSLLSSLDVYKAKVAEVSDTQVQNPPLDGVAVFQDGSVMVERTDINDAAQDEHPHSSYGKQDGRKPISDVLEESSSADLLELAAPDDYQGLVSFNAHLEEAERTLQQLEKEIELTHYHLASSSKSGGKAATPAVSKLIQAFESNSQHEEQEMEDNIVIPGQSTTGDPLLSSKKFAGTLKAVLRQLSLDAERATLAYKREQDGLTAANATMRDLKLQVEALAEQYDNLEMTNIEHEVLHEAFKQHMSSIEENNIELQVVCEKLRWEDSSLKTHNSELHRKLNIYHKRIEELQIQLHELQKISNEVVSGLPNQLESSQKDIAEWALKVEQEWKFTFSQIVEAVERLDNSVGVEQRSGVSADRHGSVDIIGWLVSSVDATVKMTRRLKKETEAATADREATFKMFSEANDKYDELLGKSKWANDMLCKFYSELKKLVSDSVLTVPETEANIHNEELLDHIHSNSYQALLEELQNCLDERQRLLAVNEELSLELLNKTKNIEDLSRQCGDLSSIEKLIGDLEGVVRQKDASIDSDIGAVSRLQSLIHVLSHKKDADELGCISREQQLTELAELQDKISQLGTLKLEHENEILSLKEQLSQSREALNAAHCNLHEKAKELEHSEQRVSSVREKLSMAVAKGKGLVVQRDGLKQSLAETSSELERCSQELELKDVRLQELETKLKAYSEAGERAEALESELSYIRNSATAIRESFLLKDSVLHRIEEILEDFDLPEHFYSRDIIDKVEWLARSVSANSVPLPDWDQKSSVGASPSDTGRFVATEAWKEEVQMSSSSVDDLRRKCEDLQGKFYGLAEQNEMLEQSLMERNQMVQRWEELLDRIDLPSSLRSFEPEDKIEWMWNAFLEANQDRNSLRQNVDALESSCGSLTADLEDSNKQITYLAADLEELQKKISFLETDLQASIQERDNLFKELAALTHDNENLSEKAARFELDSEKWHDEVTVLREKLVEKEGQEYQIQHINDEIVRLQDIVCNTLQDPGAKDLVGGGSGTECLEGLLMKLIANYGTHSILSSSTGIVAEEEQGSERADSSFVEGRTRDAEATEQLDVARLEPGTVDDPDGSSWDALKKELEETSNELGQVKEERDEYISKQESLISELEALERKRMELQDLLTQEEQKCASAKEKLNIAVRKGKSLVQQRDSLKQTIEELNIELERLKSEIRQQESTLVNYEQKITDLSSTYSERIEALESETLFFQNRSAEAEQLLHEREQSLARVVDILGNIDLGDEVANTSSPFEKLEHIRKLYQDMHAALASSQQESAKSRRASELLLAELNEVQERNDVLQEELSRANFELSELSRARDLAEAAKSEAVSRIQELSIIQSDKKKKQNAELTVLISSTDQLRKIFSDVNNIIVGHLSKDIEFIQNLDAGVESFLQKTEADDLPRAPFFSNPDNKDMSLAVEPFSEAIMQDNFDDSISFHGVCSSVQECMNEIVALKKLIQDHSLAALEEADKLCKRIHTVHREISHDRESSQTLKRDVEYLESIVKQKESEAAASHKNLLFLYETCLSSLKEIGTRKAESTLAPGNFLGQELLDVGLPVSGKINSLSEEHIRSISERMMNAVKDFISLNSETVEGDRKEMRMTITSLQRELQEKDIQRERICMELAGQIKEAEAVATRHSLDLQASKARLIYLEKQVELAMEERNSLEQQRANEIEDERKISTDLNEKISLLSDTVAAKDQEIEALTQALDEEEAQMEDLTRKCEEQEKALQQKNLEIENLESSRGKVLKKLSITMSKFDELHRFSEGLLAEIEKLQSQLQDRDGDVSFLRQEVTRCTNDVLVASQTSDKRNVDDEIHQFFLWLDNLVPQSRKEDVNVGDNAGFHEYKEAIQKKIASFVSELEDQRVAAQTTDTLLQLERNKVEDLLQREEVLEKSLHEKESQLNMLEGGGEVRGSTASATEILETEPLINKWTVAGPSTTSQVRSLRKANNDQVAIAIDMDQGGSDRLEDEDDDKVHGFKSLTTSRIVPRFTRPVSDVIDGLWVSCDRALMRQPAFRLGIMMYWAVMHLLLVAFVF